MTKIHTIPPFGKIDFNNLEMDYYAYNHLVNDISITMDLNFDQDTMEEEFNIIIIRFIEKIPELTKYIHKQINKEFTDGKVVSEYIDHHFKDCDTSELAAIGIDTEKEEQEIKKSMLEKIHLKRIGIYPEYKTFGVFDFTLNADITQYLIVVNVNKNGEVLNIVIES